MDAQNFNLVDSPWIPISGKGLISLRDLFSDPGIAHLGGNAVDKIVIFRLLLAIAHASTDIPDKKAWHALSLQQLSKSAADYLERWHDAFYLHGDRPFLQMKALSAPNMKKDETWLLRVNASDNKAMLTEWEWTQRDDDMPDEELAILLLRQICFACSGYKSFKDEKSGLRSGNYIVLTPGYKGKLKNDSGKAGQLASGTLLGNGYLHAYFQGESLMESVKYNLLTDEEIRKLNAFTNGTGRPAWEQMPQGEACERAIDYVNSYQGQLLPLDKFVFIEPGNKKFTVTTGINYPSQESLLEPALIRNEKDKFLVIRQDRRIWRDLTAILSFLTADSKNPTPYFLSFGLPRIRDCDIETISIWAGGMSVSGTAGVQMLKGRDDYIESSFSFPMANLGTHGFEVFKLMIEEMDKYSGILKSAVFKYSKQLQPDVKSPKDNSLGNAIAAKGLAEYWHAMEQNIQQVINIAFQEDDNESDSKAIIDAIYKQWRSEITSIYDKQCPHTTSRQLLAWSDARPFSPQNKNLIKIKDHK